MLPPTASVAGKVVAFTVKLALEEFNSAICMAAVPSFVIATVRYTGVPTLTSPKSIVDGLTTRAGVLELVEENGLLAAPQPARPRLIPRAANPKGIA
jgi:hypothetical protein